jgi:excisionase family DNA binding protein
MKTDLSANDPGPEPLDSIRDIARRVGCSKRTIARKIASGELDALKFNARLVRVKRSVVEAWIARAQGDQ